MKISQFLIGRQQGMSRFLIGNLKDSDKDKYPDIMDCSPFNKKQHGFTAYELEQLRSLSASPLTPQQIKGQAPIEFRPAPTEEELKRISELEAQKQIQIDEENRVKAIQQNISIEQERLDNLRRQLAKIQEGGVSKSEKSAYYELEDKIAMQQNIIIPKLQQALEKGYTPGQAVELASTAEQASLASIERTRMVKQQINPYTNKPFENYEEYKKALSQSKYEEQRTKFLEQQKVKESPKKFMGMDIAAATELGKKLTPEEYQKFMKPVKEEPSLFKRTADKISSIEAGIIPSLTLSREVYLPTREDIKTYQELLDKTRYNPIERYKLDQFIQKQENKLKEDILTAEKYNIIVEKTGKYPSDYEEVFKRLESGYLDTGWNILKKGTIESKSKGEKVNILGQKVKPSTSSYLLKGLTTAYQAEKVVLEFQIGGAALGYLGLAPSITGSPSALKAFKVVSSTAGGLIGGSAMVESSVREYTSTKDIGYSISAGVGTGLGFFGSVYSKELVSVGKILSKGVPLKSKKGAMGGLTQVESEYTEVYDSQTGQRRFIKKSEMTRLQAVSEFKRLSRSEQIKIITQSFLVDSKTNKIKIYLDKKSFDSDVLKAKEFLKESGLNDAQIQDRISAMEINLQIAQNLINYKSGKITEQQYLDNKRILEYASNKLIMKTQKLMVYSEPIEVSVVKSKGGIIIPKQEIIGKMSPVVTPILKSESIYAGKGLYERTDFITGSAINEQQAFVQISKGGIASASGFALSSLITQKNKQKSEPESKISSIYKFKSKQKQEQPQKIEQVITPYQRFSFKINTPTNLFVSPNYSISKPIIEPEPVKPVRPTIGGDFFFPEETKKFKQDNTPYDAYAFIDATKGRKAKWVQVADNVPYQTALSMGGRFVDQSSLSSQFKVVKDKGELNRTSDNTWLNIAYKFRDYMIRKGTKMQTPNKFVEKRKYRLDSPQEVRSIQRAKNLRWL